MRIARALFAAQREAAKRVQKLRRSQLSRAQFRAARRGAMRLQGGWRNVIRRKKAANEMLMVKCVVRLQAIWRGHRTAAVWSVLRALLAMVVIQGEANQIKNHAAVVLQRAVHAQTARRHALKRARQVQVFQRNHAAKKLQRCARGLHDRLVSRALRLLCDEVAVAVDVQAQELAAAEFLQSRWRGKSARAVRAAAAADASGG